MYLDNALITAVKTTEGSKRFSQVLKFLKMVINYFENQIYQIHLIKVLAFYYSLLFTYINSTVCTRKEIPESLGVKKVIYKTFCSVYIHTKARFCVCTTVFRFIKPFIQFRFQILVDCR